MSFILANRFFGRRTCFKNYESLRTFLNRYCSFNVQSRINGKRRGPLISTGQLDLNKTTHGYRLTKSKQTNSVRSNKNYNLFDYCYVIVKPNSNVLNRRYGGRVGDTRSSATARRDLRGSTRFTDLINAKRIYRFWDARARYNPYSSTRKQS